MTLRRNPITQLPVISAPERARRPNAFGSGEELDRCPFCPGHETDTPPEVARVGDETRWRIRTFPNKFPAVRGHEVIVESPEHEAAFDAIPNPAEIVAHYIDRYETWIGSATWVSLFKNHGAAAGASIPHIHSQLMPLDFTPPRVEAELNGFERERDCPLCSVANVRGERVIEESENFVRVVPEAATFAWQQWIVPRRHHSGIGELGTDEIVDLGRQLANASRGMRAISASYNWLFMNYPGHKAAHFYVEAFPRLTRVAGFELATGVFINVTEPAAVARRYREIDASAD